MNRPTIALCMIVKNEAHNLPKLFESIEGCFDQVHITDTGSTDDTIAVAEKYGAKVHHFEWVNDFAAARNYSFSHADTDFLMWLDGDDVLQNREAFIKWRDDCLDGSDYWIASYHYSSHPDGTPACSFARERVVRRVKGMKWKYFVHEGILPESANSDVRANYATSWAVKHVRSEEDVKVDRSRNLNLFKKNLDKLDARMRFYYGKELFEAEEFVDAITHLMDAASSEKLENHDRILALQYVCYSYMRCTQYDKAIQIAHQGLQLAPNRAEFYCLIGDCYLKKENFQNAFPYFQTAKHCTDQNDPMSNRTGAIFTYKDCYGSYPRNQIARLYSQQGRLDEAEKEAQECVTRYQNKEAEALISEIQRIKKVTAVEGATEKTDDIVFSVPPVGLYEWDAEIAKAKGIGGSETACVQMAYWLKKIMPERRVMVFNPRKEEKTIDGVEYVPVAKLNEYFSKYIPGNHIAWRHNIKLTTGKTALWCHDLVAQHVENTDNYERVLCLSNYHKRYLHAMTGVPEDKIHLTRNGIDPARFEGKVADKVKGRVIYSSSPDRGLDKAIRVMDHVVKQEPEAELHVFYGFENMEKMGLHSQVANFRKMIDERPYVHYHGNKQQNELVDEFLRAEVWLYPTYFQETFCITAIEALACQVFPVVRRFGALQDTLRNAEEMGMAKMLDHPYDTESQGMAYADEVVKAIREQKWKSVKINLEDYSWESVAKEWAKWLTP